MLAAPLVKDVVTGSDVELVQRVSAPLDESRGLQPVTPTAQSARPWSEQTKS